MAGAVESYYVTVYTLHNAGRYDDPIPTRFQALIEFKHKKKSMQINFLMANIEDEWVGGVRALTEDVVVVVAAAVVNGATVVGLGRL
jgi:hypothetical protein